MRRLLLLVFLSTGFSMYSQYGTNCEIRQFKLNAINPGVEYEMALGVNSTLDIRVAYQVALEPASSQPLEDFDFFPAITVQNRYYHNLRSRERRKPCCPFQQDRSCPLYAS